MLWYPVRDRDLEVRRVRDHPLPGGLQGILDELAEAARHRRRELVAERSGTSRILLLGPTIRIWAFLSIIGSLQLFDLVWIVTGGGRRTWATTDHGDLHGAVRVPADLQARLRQRGWP